MSNFPKSRLFTSQQDNEILKTINPSELKKLAQEWKIPYAKVANRRSVLITFLKKTGQPVAKLYRRSKEQIIAKKKEMERKESLPEKFISPRFARPAWFRDENLFILTRGAVKEEKVS